MGIRSHCPHRLIHEHDETHPDVRPTGCTYSQSKKESRLYMVYDGGVRPSSSDLKPIYENASIYEYGQPEDPPLEPFYIWSPRFHPVSFDRVKGPLVLWTWFSHDFTNVCLCIVATSITRPQVSYILYFYISYSVQLCITVIISSVFYQQRYQF